MNRRAVVAGLGAAAFAGCDVRRATARVVERARGCVDLALPAARGVAVEAGVLADAGSTAKVGFALAMPEGARVDRVAYLLPGRGGKAADALGGMAAFLAEHLRGGGVPFAIAAMDAGESYFHRRTNGEDRFAVATVALPRLVMHRLGAAPRAEAIMGQSMGGYGALLAAETFPTRYRAVAVAGPAIFPSYDDENRSVGDAFDSAGDYAAHDVTAHAARLRGVPVHVSVGRRDPFLPGVRRFGQALPSAQIQVRDGCHDSGFWRASAPDLIAFVARAFR